MTATMTVTVTASHRVIRLNRIALYQINESHSVILGRSHTAPRRLSINVLPFRWAKRRKKKIETNYDGMALEILCIIISTTISLQPGIYSILVFFAVVFFFSPPLLSLRFGTDFTTKEVMILVCGC